MTPAIEITNVSKKYPLERMRRKRRKILRVFLDGLPKIAHVQALRNISIRIQKGECIGIIGPNGSGKSTLLGIIAGILTADTGKISTNGTIVSLLHTKLGIPEMSGESNRQFLSALFGMRQKQINKTKKEVFKTAGLQNFADTPLMKYSRGMKDRLMLSLSLSTKPDILLLDEALSESDETFRNRFANTLKTFAATGKTVILISHELSLIEKMCTRTIWLQNGKIRMDASTTEVLKNYREAATHATKV